MLQTWTLSHGMSWIAPLLVDEVMVPLDVRIEHDAVLGQRQRAQQPLLDEEVERVVDRGPRDVRHARLDAIPDHDRPRDARSVLST